MAKKPILNPELSAAEDFRTIKNTVRVGCAALIFALAGYMWADNHENQWDKYHDCQNNNVRRAELNEALAFTIRKAEDLPLNAPISTMSQSSQEYLADFAKTFSQIPCDDLQPGLLW